MANNNGLDALLSQVPVGEIAAKLGIDEDTALEAVKHALPGLLGGLAVNASSDEGAQKLEGALSSHAPAEGTISLEAINEEDGAKIVKHALGDNQDAVAQALGAQSGNAGIAKFIPMLLPLLAPIVMQFLAGRIGGGAGQAAEAGEAAAEQSGGIGDVLGGLLGGLTGGNGGSAQGGGIGDILGGLLGGGGGKSQGGGLGGLLGGLLGK